MTKKPTESDALEALDFIINVLREHEKDLDRLITELKDLDRLIAELGKISERFSETGELAGKIEKIEDRLSAIQNEISSVIKSISTPREQQVYPRGPPVIVRCKNWEDFKVLAAGAETVSFLFKETEKSFQADALKEGRVVTYSGEFPRDSKLLKIWLSKELNVAQERIFEGVLAIG